MQEISILASRAFTTQKRFMAVADNVANVNTAGYRRLEMDFKEVLSRPRGVPSASYVQDRTTRLSHNFGSFEQTGNQLDVALGGEGYFAVQVGADIHYTRRGQFLVNSEGTLVTQEGDPVLDNANAQIQVPQGVKNIMIASDGTISTEEGQLAQLGVFTFGKEDEAKLVRAGNTAFAAPGAAAMPVESPIVRQGFVESSNVNATQELVNMQMVSKAYQSAIGQLNDLNDLQTRAIRTLGGSQ